jgi:thiol:disulfide interchange protein
LPTIPQKGLSILSAVTLRSQDRELSLALTYSQSTALAAGLLGFRLTLA